VRTFTFVGAIALLVVASTSYSSSAYWSHVPKAPEFIVVGAIRDISKSSYEIIGPARVGESRVVDIYDSGIVEVEEVLFGEDVPTLLPISWVARCRLEPPVEKLAVGSGNERAFVEGETQIWVLWPKSDDRISERSKYHGFQALSVETKARVIGEIEEKLRK